MKGIRTALFFNGNLQIKNQGIEIHTFVSEITTITVKVITVTKADGSDQVLPTVLLIFW